MSVLKVNRIAVYLSLIVIGLMFSVSATAVIDPDTIAGLWLFDEGKGGETEDASGNGHDGVLEGNPSWADGQFGKALEFSGGDYVELIDSAPDLPFGATDPFTVTAWVKNQGGGTIIGKFNGGVIGAYIITMNGAGAVGFHREVAPWGLSGVKTIRAGEFGHIAATYDGTTMRIYVDGELDVEQDRPAQNTDTATLSLSARGLPVATPAASSAALWTRSPSLTSRLPRNRYRRSCEGFRVQKLFLHLTS